MPAVSSNCLRVFGWGIDRGRLAGTTKERRFFFPKIALIMQSISSSHRTAFVAPFMDWNQIVYFSQTRGRTHTSITPRILYIMLVPHRAITRYPLTFPKVESRRNRPCKVGRLTMTRVAFNWPYPTIWKPRMVSKDLRFRLNKRRGGGLAAGERARFGVIGSESTYFGTHPRPIFYQKHPENAE